MSKICLCCGKPLKEDSPSFYHATCTKRFFGQGSIPRFDINDIVHEELAEKNIENGSSVPGVQKKLSISLPGTRKTIATGRQYILEASSEDKPFLPEFEFIGMKLAEIAGFKTVPNALVPSSEGGWIYLTKRIDRGVADGKEVKIAMEDFAQLSGKQTEYKYNGSYEQCAKKVIDRFSCTAYLDKILLFRMVFFSYIIGNTDMHLKNFSLLKGPEGYSLSPFYDILPVLMVVDQKEMALTVNGKNQKIDRSDFLRFSETIGLSEKLASSLMESILGKLDDMFAFIRESPIPQDKQDELIALIQSRAIPFAKR